MGFYIKNDVAVAKSAKQKNALFRGLKIDEQESFYDELISYLKAEEDANNE
ncbi:hypothetical protein MCOL2_04626 [Listeria fleischmannii FSL S10-1203]|uniref:Uncharacterized protein n=1 Tax=Listeria fleischmannii FSL S10-1203 TaxID=1265822 RepID=W7DHM6_9LIST|nr:hypothetical protein MCOL2_04626 [Listeria fleischmannii FSL S10-1203]